MRLRLVKHSYHAQVTLFYFYLFIYLFIFYIRSFYNREPRQERERHKNHKFFKLDIKNKHQTQLLLRLTIRDAALQRYQVRPVSFQTFQPLRIKQGEKQKRCHPKSDSRL